MSIEFKSWEDSTVCLEIYLHTLANKPLCWDCQNYWDGWNESQRDAAIILGRNRCQHYMMIHLNEKGYFKSKENHER